MQPGECDLTIQSRQNPEITETYHVIVTNPITKLDILAGDKRVAAGDTLQLDVNYTPNTATMMRIMSSRAMMGPSPPPPPRRVRGMLRPPRPPPSR